MRSDVVRGNVFPDYALPDHTNTVRKLSDLQGRDPMVLLLSRGHFLTEGAPAAPPVGGVPITGSGRLHPDGHDLDR